MTDRPVRFNRRTSLRGRSQTLGSSDHLTGNGNNSRSSSRNSSFQNFFPPEDMNDLESGRSSSFIQNGNGTEYEQTYSSKFGLKRFQPKLGFLWCWLFVRRASTALSNWINFVFLRNIRIFRIVVATIVVLLGFLFIFSFGIQWEFRKERNGVYFQLQWRDLNDNLEDSPGPWIFGVVADLDKNSRVSKDDSRVNGVWKSYFKRGKLARTEDSSFVVEWLDQKEGVEILTKISEDGRGMELSDLCRFQNKTFAPDDRTGIIYEIVNPLGGINGISGAPYAATRYVLPDGNGNDVKGFKGEWMTVKDGYLYVGGHGRERTDAKNGTQIESYNPMWIKRIDSRGNIEHIDWSDNYNSVRKAVGASFPGYLENEAVLWSSRRRSWIFLPRRWSLEPYDDEKNEFRGWNKIVVCDESFSDIRMVNLDMELEEEKGFSSARFVPGSKETLICALRTIEHEEKRVYATYMTIFSVESGSVVLPDILIGNQKYEGIEFLAGSL
ncbi:hypothetical protein GpartN1_g6245.t1 [Galdieria partita]|uniref:Apyrase n=1 Tax=Galdieria partita TaxID=83374 RepID=A0A9C7USS1_9RHOD|nr:hypothetical protein GpartN1_g6245.t1 [Galdieria partita]